MRAVLYATDLEPITVLSLEPWAIDYLRRWGIVRLHVIPQIAAPPPPLDDAHMEITMQTVTLRAERLRRGRHETMMLFTDDDESALLLKAAFLPGQTRVLRDREAAAFAEGFLHAMTRLR